MYNRYIRRDDGTYTKVAEPEPPRQETADHGSQPPPPPRQTHRRRKLRPLARWSRPRRGCAIIRKY